MLGELFPQLVTLDKEPVDLIAMLHDALCVHDALDSGCSNP
jgi:hypothetical protein